VLARENNETVVVRDVSNHEVSIAKNNIAKRTTGGSLMPSGLADALKEGERLDLYRFLSELGKPGPYDASRGAVARLWRLRPGIHTTEQFGMDKLLTSDLRGGEWSLALTQVDGSLSSTRMRDVIGVQKYNGVVGLYAAARFQSPKEGNIRLNLTGAPVLSAWIDGKAVAPDKLASASVAAGDHTLIVKLDAQKLPDTLRVESPDATFLAE
ncbi:MAG TPA: hypothetical protein VHH73_00440, partial [Verrucomicrobiae bacterium]|nr:hypothetical protein [Verrucomicrobiae bacterium]